MKTDLRIGPVLVVPVTAEPFTGYVEVTGGEITHLGPSSTDGPAAETVAAPATSPPSPGRRSPLSAVRCWCAARSGCSSRT